MVFTGNFSKDVTRSIIRNVIPGYDLQIFRGYARFTTTPATSWQILDENTDQPLTIAANASPLGAAWIHRIEFNLERPLLGSNGDVLKLGGSVADSGGFILNSTAVAAGQLAAQVALAAPAPFSPVSGAGLSANFAPSFFLHNGANAAPVGTLALPANAAPLMVPVRLLLLRRSPVLTSRDLMLSASQQRLIAGIS